MTPHHPDPAPVEVLPCDREAAADAAEAFYDRIGWPRERCETPGEMRRGERDYDPIVQAFARHRLTHSTRIAGGGKHVPGVFACPKCKFRLIKQTLYVRSGTVGDDDTPGDPCPNCGTNLWRVSWQDEAKQAYEVAESQMNRALAAEADAARLREALQPFADAAKRDNPDGPTRPILPICRAFEASILDMCATLARPSAPCAPQPPCPTVMQASL